MIAYPALTLWQPWASLVAEGLKTYEFRSWAAPRGLWGRRIAIHAGARPVRRGEIQELLLKLQSPTEGGGTGLCHRGVATEFLEQVLVAPRSLPLSSVLCIATLGQPLRNAELAARLGVALINDSDRDGHSNWGWPLSDIERLEPFQPAQGAQGFWTWRQPT